MDMIGIYKIENLINHKVYIGQSLNVSKRLRDHRDALKCNKHFCIHLQHSFNKYGEENFSFEILEECSKEELNDKEKYWINFYGGYISINTYNQREGGNSHFELSEETKQKLRECNLGKKVSAETRDKQSKALKGHPYWGGGEWTPERKQRLSKYMLEHPVENFLHYNRQDIEYRKRLSNSLKGKKKSALHAQHISEGRRGIVFSEEHKKNISLGRKGIASIPKGSKKIKKGDIVKWARPEEIELFKQEGWEEYHEFYAGKDYVRGEPWNKGKPCSEETKQKLRECNLGKRLSPETCKKMAETRKNMVWINNGIISKFILNSELEKYQKEGWKRGRKK